MMVAFVEMPDFARMRGESKDSAPKSEGFGGCEDPPTMNVLALAVFVSYFALIIALFCIIVVSWGCRPHLGFVLLAAGSFIHTWYCALISLRDVA